VCMALARGEQQARECNTRKVAPLHRWSSGKWRPAARSVAPTSAEPNSAGRKAFFIVT
jgi:hypothetical protein